MLIAYLVLLCEFFFRICEFSLLQTSGRYLLTSALKSDHFKQTPVIVDNGQFFTCPINISSYQKVTLANTDSSLSSVSCSKAYLFSERRKKMDDSFSIFTVLQLTAQEVQHQLLTIVTLLWQRVSSAKVVLIKDSPLIRPLSMFPVSVGFLGD